jgi:hypothetical protein
LVLARIYFFIHDRAGILGGIANFPAWYAIPIREKITGEMNSWIGNPLWSWSSWYFLHAIWAGKCPVIQNALVDAVE